MELSGLERLACTDIFGLEALIGDLKLCLAYNDMSIQHGTNHSAIEEMDVKKVKTL